MVDFLNNLFAFFEQKKKLLLKLSPFFFVAFFIIFVFLFSFTGSPPQQEQNISPTETVQPSPFPTDADSQNVNTDADADLDNISLYEKKENFQKKETISNGAIQYTLSSSVNDRPEIVIINPQNDIVLFQRTVRPRDNNSLLPQYVSLYGQPQEVLSGSQFYGQDSQTYIFADNGVAVIANPQTDTVFEIHYFVPSTVTEYINNYGDDLTITPTP